MSQSSKISMLILLISMALFVGACSSQTPGTNPDDMSAEEHHKHSDEHQKVADEHQKDYAPDAHEIQPHSAVDPDSVDPEWEFFTVDVYNPTEHHRDSAEQHQHHADQHRQAAEELLSYEQEQCEQFPEESRSACPLMGQIQAVDDIEGGARLTFHDDVPLDAAVAHIRCHFAFARTVGRQGMDSCPLYIEGLSITEESDEHSVILTTDHPEAVEALRLLSQEHLTH